METNQYLEVFIDESKEHLQTINDHLLVLEKNPQDLTIVNEIFRSAHTLKGMSATMGYQDLSNLTHKMENVLDAVRNEQVKVDGEMLDVVFDSVDDLEAMVIDISEGGSGERNVERVVQLLQTIENGEALSSIAPPDDGKTSEGTPVQIQLDEFTSSILAQSSELGKNNLHIKVTLREDCLLRAARVYMVFEILEQAGEVVQAQPPVDQLENEEFESTFHVLLVTDESSEELENKINKVSEIESVVAAPYEMGEPQKQEKNQVNDEPVAPQNGETRTKNPNEEKETKQVGNKTIRINIDRLDALMNLFEELVIDRGRLEQISEDLQHTELRETVERMSRISGDLQSIILNMRMVPVEQVFNRFPRMVRQLSRDLNKKIDLHVVGAETELDRTVIDEIGDPLVHLIRNALDHGIESPEEREAKGKPATGKLELKAYHSGNHVFIEISDDGGGINRDKVVQKAVANQVVTEEQAATMTDSQVYDLIMESGFSTADSISDVSGRGVGLDVVKNTIESLGGNITVDSQPGHGSIFSIQLPLTLSIISVMLVEVQKEKYAIPLSSIIETAIVKKEDIMHAHNKKVIDFRGKVVPLVSLMDVLDVPEELEEEEYYSVVIVRKGDKMAALIVNSFIGQQEVVLKSLGDYLSGAFAISGATILGDGQVALILDSNALIK
ncbi:two-component system, chemotaxis family, sensor kinase CheA [Halobacillus dabanensis]|uniref:Chemotaxis protein CheA n=1 Tax=Halobacillus dabanensis TaxID=240302 RepID=A0A1I3Y7J5_HALDA|nr:chemotaxis protein CheA [Halobacillus dabanensis]SFK27241.1 two-component system, chemotaxis family, sensor kinase CheA [Halobacillus dabanensis]